MTGTSLVEAVYGWADRRPDAVALADESRVLSWSDLAGAVDAAARRLTDQGVAGNSRVAILAPLSLEAAIAALAVLEIGASACPLPVDAGEDRLRAALADLDPALVLAGHAHARTVDDTGVRVLPLPPIDLATDAAQRLLPPLAEPHLMDPTEACVLTDPETGERVGHSHASLAAGIFELALQAPELLGGRALGTYPLACAAGLVHGLLAPLVLGGGVVLLPTWDAADALRMISDERIVAVHTSTARWRRLAEELDVRDRDTSSLRVATVHDALDGDPARRWVGRRVELRRAVGLTATRPAAAFAHVEPVGSGTSTVGILHRAGVTGAVETPVTCPSR